MTPALLPTPGTAPAQLMFSETHGTCAKEPACQCRRHKRHGFGPWVWEIPWKRT